MSQMTVAATPAAARAERGSGAWLYGRWTDLFFGCGVAYLLSLPLLFAFSRWTGVDSWSDTYAMAFALLINGPHYGATLLRVYDTREDRRKYRIFAVYASIAFALVFFAASRSLWLASVLITVYLTWSPWHFSGQNYGLMLMFLRRRGVDVDPLSKRIVHASFVLSAVLAMVAIHGGYEEFVFAPATLHVANTPSVLSIKLPHLVSHGLSALLLAAYLGCVGASFWRLRARAPVRELAPAFLLVLTQSLWFTLPALRWDAIRSQTLVFSAIWVSTWHSLQYLWINAYYARSSGRQDSARRFFVKATIAGTAISAIPGALMAPQWLGNVPWDAGLAATLYAVVNLHHFVLDGAIWKLRDGRVARVLLRTPEPEAVAVASPARAWLRPLVFSLAALGLAVPVAEIVAKEGIARGGAPDVIQRWTRVLDWVGRDTLNQQFLIGSRYAKQGYHQEAIGYYQRSLELFPTGRAWFSLANEYRVTGQWQEARSAYESAIALNPEVAAFHLGRAEALLASDGGAPDDAARAEAVASLEHALALRPKFGRAAVTLARLDAESGATEQAIQTLESALPADDAAGDLEVRSELARLRPEP